MKHYKVQVLYLLQLVPILTLMLIMSIDANAQVYTCEQLVKDINSWNAIKNSNETKWAIAIRDQKLYKTNADGSFEYVYIFNTTDNVDIPTLRKIGFDFINYNFHIDNAMRADMETNSPQDGIIYKGMLLGVGSFNSVLESNQINAYIYFDIRFKPNRIRFSAKIQEYQVIRTSRGEVLENHFAYVKNCFPLNEDSRHKKSYAKAFINSNSNCMNFANGFLSYLNLHVKEKQPTIADDW